MTSSAQNDQKNKKIKIYTWGSRGPLILILAGVHGDETCPIKFFSNLVKHGLDFNRTNNFQLAIIPCVNPCGCEEVKRRDCSDNDINRSWLKPNPVMEYWVEKADVIYDFHEARKTWEHGDLGKSMYTTHPAHTSATIIKPLLTKLNWFQRQSTDLPVAKWVNMPKVPYTGGRTLDEYCLKNEKPYVLFELLGIESQEYKTQQMQIIWYHLFGDTVLQN